MLKISAPDTLTIDRVDIGLLPENWTTRHELTQMIGSQWLESGASPLFEVPSALVPETFNILLNPLHSDAGEIVVLESRAYPFDARLKA